MVKIVPTTTINMGDQSYEVERMSEPVQRMIAVLDEWRQYEAEYASKLLMAQCALNDLQNKLQATLIEERESAAKAAAALGLLPDVNSTAPLAQPQPEPNQAQSETASTGE